MLSPRHNCAVCHSRKPEDDFPLTTSGTRALATCMGCLEQSLLFPDIWADLLLQPPGQTAVKPTDNLGTDLPSTTPPNTAVRKRKRRRAAGSWPYKPRKRVKAVSKNLPFDHRCYDPDDPETYNVVCKFCYRAGVIQCKDRYRRGMKL